MVSLAAASVIENARSAPGVADFYETGRDFANRRVPIDFLEGAVGLAPERRGQTVAPILIEVYALGLLARVTVRGDMSAVTAYAGQVAVFNLDFDSAIYRTQDACRFLPFVSHLLLRTMWPAVSRESAGGS